MSPENLGSSQYSEKSDVWSFGCLIIELITGAVPFGSRDILEIAVAVRDWQLTALSVLDPSIFVPKWARELVEQCFEFDEQSRPNFARIVEFLDRHVPAGVTIDKNEDAQPVDLLIPVAPPEGRSKPQASSSSSASASASSSSSPDSDSDSEVGDASKTRYEMDRLS